MHINYLISTLLMFFNSLCFASNIETNNHEIEHKEPLDQSINVEDVEIDDGKEIYICLWKNGDISYIANCQSPDGNSISKRKQNVRLALSIHIYLSMYIYICTHDIEYLKLNMNII